MCLMLHNLIVTGQSAAISISSADRGRRVDGRVRRIALHMLYSVACGSVTTINGASRGSSLNDAACHKAEPGDGNDSWQGQDSASSQHIRNVGLLIFEPTAGGNIAVNANGIKAFLDLQLKLFKAERDD
eukprot:TRINITY_DN4855_c0_g1_i1.p1 TRINITY_DN4855_c0_g1~~TRINITY_DN4855_c0_g1_i1.p1  ORF type:complete len:129 (-),score=12.35 TRINITY_DN4855_c0_g1_i1:690-1076(-)